MDGGGGLVGAAPSISFQQFREAGFVNVAHRAVAVRMDPFRMLGAQIVVNLDLKRGHIVDRMRTVNWHSHRCRRDQHEKLDNRTTEVVQIDYIKIC